MDYLSLSRAARLAGVTRAELQRRIRRGEIATFEGSVAVVDLLRIFPSVSLSDDAALERVERIKADAQPRLPTEETALPNPQVLVSRLRGLSETLVDRISALGAADRLLQRVGDRLEKLVAEPPGELAESVRETRDWFLDAYRQLGAQPLSDQRAQLFAKDTFLRIMAANVKLIPSGHDFFVEGSESILEASVRAGLRLGYGCSSGNCGDCKARVLSGETWKIRDHDYVISEREKAMGYILTCSQTAVTDLVMEAAEATTVEDLPQQRIRASLRKLERLSPDLIALNVQTPRTQTLRFMAGQRVGLRLEAGATCELSIASCPCNGRNLWFYVRREDDDFAAAVFGDFRPGQLITVTGPKGAFVLQEDSPEPTVFIAFGDGIAPIKSLIEHAVSIDLIESFHLYWDTRYPEGHHQGQWGRALRDALDNFSFTPLASGQPSDVLAVVCADHPNLAGLRFYLAGPPSPLRGAVTILREHGVDEDLMTIEETAT